MTVPTAPRRRPEGRYDEPSLLGQRALAVLLGALFLGLIAAVFLALYQRFGDEDVRGRVLSYDVTSDREVSIEVEVAKPAGQPAYCVIRARGSSGAEVGRDAAAVDPEGTSEQTARGRFTLVTSARAVTGEVGACTTEPLSREDVAP